MDVCKQFEYDKLYQLAIKIARKAHKGQFRKDGVTEYIKHPLELADMFDDYLDKSLAVFHDTIEDGADRGVTYEYILDQLDRGGFSDDTIIYIMTGLEFLTHDKSVDTYKEYVQKIAVTIYKKFKIADITVNLAGDPSDYQKMKYKKAMKILLRAV